MNPIPNASEFELSDVEALLLFAAIYASALDDTEFLAEAA